MHQLVRTLLLTLSKNNKKTKQKTIHTQRADFVRLLPGNLKKKICWIWNRAIYIILTSICTSPGKPFLFVITGISHKLPGNTASVEMINSRWIHEKKALRSEKMWHSLKTALLWNVTLTQTDKKEGCSPDRLNQHFFCLRLWFWRLISNQKKKMISLLWPFSSLHLYRKEHRLLLTATCVAAKQEFIIHRTSGQS